MISGPTCRACGFGNPPGARFCGRCGDRLAAGCPTCGEPIRSGLPFCTACGTPLAVQPEPTRRLPVQIPLPREQRRIVSVLFVDLVGYTVAAAASDPEDLRRMQSAYFGTARMVIERYGGTVEKYIGDAVMACFGAPTAHEDDPYRAVAAALHVRDALLDQRLPGGRPMRVRLGVATGEALVDLDADRQAMVAGDVVNIACRLEEHAQPGTILVDLATARATGSLAEFAEAAPILLPGRPDPVQCRAALRTVAPPAGGVSSTAVIGRDSEIALLTGALRRTVRDRSPQLVTILGDAGLGKSRLVRELEARLGEVGEPVRWRVGHCPPYGESVTFWALAEIVKTHAGVLDSDTAEAARAKVTAAVAAVLPPEDAPGVADRLAPLLGLGAGSPSAEEARAAWTRFLLAIAEDQPLALVVEDLHWADDALLDFLEGLLGAAGHVPLLLVVTARPHQLSERRPDWGAQLRDSVKIPLSPLDGPQTAALFGALLGRSVLPAETQRRLIGLAGGNPLYAAEYVRMLADTGALRPGSGRRALPSAGLPLPQSVHSLIASRLDLLAPAERAVLQAAAVVGQQFSAGAAAAVAGADPAVVEPALQALDRRQIVRRRATPSVRGDTDYEFRHVLVRDVAYAQIPRATRAEQHRRTADWLDAVTATREDDIAELLAHHRVAAYDLVAERGAYPALNAAAYAEPARRALLAAADRAARLHALSAARGYVDRALALWPAGVDPAGRWRAIRLAQEVCFFASEDEFYAGDGPTLLAEAAVALLALGDVAEAARAETLLGQVEWYRAEAAAAFGHLGRAVALLATEPPSEQKATAYAELARLHMLTHHHTAAIEAATVARGMAHALDQPEIEAGALVTIGTARYLSGNPAGVADQEAAVDLARRHRLRALHRAANNLAATLQEEGQLRRSYELIEESEAVGRNAGLSLTSKFSEPDVAMRAYFAGDWGRALAVSDAWLGGLVTATPHPWEIHLRALCAWLRLLRGAPAQTVEPDLRRALELARRGSFPQLLRPALAHAALCRVITGDLPEAAPLYDELDTEWRDEPASASREWIQAAVNVGSQLDAYDDGDRVLTVVRRLEALRRPTLWVHAALASGRAHLAAGRPEAGALAAEAAERYAEIGDLSDQALATLHAARAYVAAGRPDQASAYVVAARAFCRRNAAVRLLAYLPAVRDLPLEVGRGV